MSKEFTLKLSDKVAARLAKLAQLNGTYSETETLQRALATYECILQQQAQPDVTKSWVNFVAERSDGRKTETEIIIT